MTSWLNSFRLTLTEWALLLLVGITTVLVVVLKVQKDKIHTMELQLLQGKLKDDLSAQNDRLAKSKKRLQDALNALHGTK
jgi:uncharacterized protein HemX